MQKGEADILGMTSMDVLRAAADNIHLSTPFMTENLAMLSQDEPTGEKDFRYDRKVPVIATTEEDWTSVYAYAGTKYVPGHMAYEPASKWTLYYGHHSQYAEYFPMRRCK